MQDSIFSKIVRGEIPSHKVYEDDKTLAFLDIHPIQPGHTLVIPKRQVEFLWDLTDEDYMALMETSKLVAKQLRTVLKKPFIGVQVIGVDVPHAHIHLIPFSIVEEFRRRPDMDAIVNHQVLSELATMIAF
jgi:histidine triad (HIT) family protein